MTVFHGGRCPPNPLGFTAFRASRWRGEREATVHRWPLHLYSRLQWRSGRSPALPYPPFRQTDYISQTVFIKTESG
jgi:hypothetical protein